MREGEPGRTRVAVDRHDEQAARPRRGEQPGRAGAKDEDPHRPALFAGAGPGRQTMDVATALTDRVEELRADHRHGASWMARRAVEALAAVAQEPTSSPQELLDDLVTAGRELANSRPGVGAVAGAVGRVLAAA